jgi:hypothetical protein
MLTDLTHCNRKESRTANAGLAKVAVQCSADTFVVNQSLVLRINICGENRHLRQARKRYEYCLSLFCRPNDGKKIRINFIAKLIDRLGFFSSSSSMY